jgi:hypothetical protein
MNLHVGIAFKETQKKVNLLPFGNISKLSSFTLYIYIYKYNDIALFYICLTLKILPKMCFRFILIIIDFKKILINLYVLNFKPKP